MAWDALANYTPDQLLALRQQIATNPGGMSTLDPNTGMTYGTLNSSGVEGDAARILNGNGVYTAGKYKPGGQYSILDAQGNDTGRTGQYGVPKSQQWLALMAAMAGGGALAGSGALGGAAGAAEGAGGVTVGAPMSVGGAAGTDLGALGATGAGAGGAAGGAAGVGGAAAGTAGGAAGGAGGGAFLGSSAGMVAPAGLGAAALPAGGNALTAALGSGGVMGLAGPAASLAGGLYGASAAHDAANVQQQSAKDAEAAQLEMFNKVVDLNEPFRQGGVAGMNALTTALGVTPGANSGWAMKDFSPSDLTTDPSYQWRLDQGNQGVARGAAASGGLGSGRYLKDLTNYSQGAASQEYGNAFNRFQTNRAAKLAPLQSLAGVGQSAAGTVGSAAQNFGNNQANLITGAGNAAASGLVGGANAITNGIGQGISSYQTNNLMNRLLQPGGGNYGGGYGTPNYSYQ